jgi:uncharacterized membrane protein
MDEFGWLLGIAGIIALVVAIKAHGRVNALQLRLDGLEQLTAATVGRRAAPSAPLPTSEEAYRPAPSPAAPQSVTPEPIVPPLRDEAAIGAAAPIIATPAAAPAKPAISLEERFGTQWTVWVGGVALAFGGFFLVRYSIEMGFFGPGMRIVLGALLAMALIAAGEWTRRSEKLSGITGLPAAHIPGILTAAGTTVAYADVYAAYALYGFLDAGGAFVLLGVVALATLAAALLHGPALAGLGLVGAYVTPLIVTSAQPNYWALYIYLAVVTAASFALARLRMWRWLAITAVVFGLLWTLPGLEGTRVVALAPHAFHVTVGFALAAALIVSGLLFGPDAEPDRIDEVSSASLATYLLAAALLVLASRHDGLALIVFVILIGATVAIAWRTEAAAGAVPAAVLLVALVFAQYAVNISLDQLVLPSGATAGAVPEPERVFFGTHLMLGAALAALFGAAGFLAQGRSAQSIVPMLWAASAVFAPLAILVALYYRIAGFDRSIPFAATALLLAALFSLATEALARRAPRPGTAAATAIFATGAVAALALALTMALEKGRLTIALALMVPGIAWILQKRPLPALRVLAGVLAALVLARIAWEPTIAGRDVGTTPIFNWLLYGYGIPAAAFWLGGAMLRRRADDASSRMVDSAALVFTVLFAFLEIRHYMTGGDVYRTANTLSETALHVCVWLAMTIGLERLRLRTKNVVHDVGALLLAGLSLLTIVVGLGFIANPMIWSYRVGGAFFNLIMLGYAVPAMLAAVLALTVRGHRRSGYSTTAAVVAVALALAYLTLEVRTLYHGPVLTAGPTTSAEQYTYSAVWLIFGVALLAAGIFLQSQAVRLASAAVVVLTVCKVFFIDMSDLTGIYQALSFIGLGVVLIGIGWFYQRLLFPRRMPASPAPA